MAVDADFDFSKMQWDFLVPTDPVENIRFRVALREWACESKANQRWIIDRCRNDICFFINAFCFGHDPRPRRGLPPVVPFILRAHQVHVIKTMRKHLGTRDIGVRKSRGEGLSFLSLILFLHSWLFENDRNFLILSRTEVSADSAGDSSSLGWKLDMIMKTLPEWMIGKKGVDWTRSLGMHSWVNRRNGSQIVSTSNTGDTSAGGRCTAILMDEFARFAHDTDILTTTEPVTDCRIFCSTFVGNQNEFYRLMHEESNLIKLQLLWRDNPDRNLNMFVVDMKTRKLYKPGTTEEILPRYTPRFFTEYFPILRKRGFVMDSKKFPLNPFIVSRMIRPRMTPAIIAQEYEGIVADESSSFFPITLIESLLERATDPTWIGDIVVHPETIRIVHISRIPDGPLRLYHHVLDIRPRPIPGPYVLGIDISMGLGGGKGSNSVISISNRTTGIKVAEFISATTPPDKLADTAIALAYWFCNSVGDPGYIIHEANGPGKMFGRRMLDLGFSNCHFRISPSIGRGKATKEPGFWTSRDTKPILLGKYRSALETGLFENPSRDGLNETLCYKVLPGGLIEFQKPGRSTAKAGESHADIVIADALTFYAAEELGGGPTGYTKTKREQPDLAKAPPGSFGARMYARRQEEKRRKQDRW